MVAGGPGHILRSPRRFGCPVPPPWVGFMERWQPLKRVPVALTHSDILAFYFLHFMMFGQLGALQTQGGTAPPKVSYFLETANSLRVSAPGLCTPCPPHSSPLIRLL